MIISNIIYYFFKFLVGFLFGSLAVSSLIIGYEIFQCEKQKKELEDEDYDQ